MNEYRESLLRKFCIYKSESLLSKYDWFSISKDKILSEEFITEFQDNVIWICISRKQNLSDEFLVKFQHKIAWDHYFFHQMASYYITKKFYHKTTYKTITHFTSFNLSKQQTQEIQRKLDFKYMYEPK
jgi:hypothetical protein